MNIENFCDIISIVRLRFFTKFKWCHFRFRFEYFDKMRDIVATDFLRYFGLAQCSFGKQLLRYRDSVLSLESCRRQSRYTLEALNVLGARHLRDMGKVFGCKRLVKILVYVGYTVKKRLVFGILGGDFLCFFVVNSAQLRYYDQCLAPCNYRALSTALS